MKVLEKFGISGKLGGRTFALLLLVFSLLLSSVPVSAAGVERGRDGSDGMAAGSDAVPGVSGAGVFSFGLRSGLEEFDAGALDPDRWDSGPDGYGHEAFVQVGGNPGNGFSMQLRYVYEEGGKTVKATYGEAAGNNTLDKASS